MFEPIGAVRRIVIHHSTESFQGPVAANARVLHLKGLARGYDAISYHYVIGNGVKGYHEINGRKEWAESADGSIELGRPLDSKGAHAIPNEGAIGIVVVGNFNVSKPTEKQLQSLQNLVLHLMYRFKLTPADVVGHHEHQQTDKRCPGKNFDMDEFRHSLNARFNPNDNIQAAIVSRRVEMVVKSSVQTMTAEMLASVTSHERKNQG
ncbi:N-acetylmuramoyl-L-alanine amidase [uncultured archaeon]|nr:N-acetylmuramoyl-L-alanine amidase [uncultured archaeon]